MKILAIDINANYIRIDDFFRKYAEFSCNQELANQTSRYLKVFLRNNQETVEKITSQCDGKRFFTVSEATRTYTVVFSLRDDCIVLEELH